MANILSEETERRVVAFVRTVANRCQTCLHRNAENCKRCLSSWANSIMKDYELDLSRVGKEERYDYTLETRVKYILSTIKKAGHPILSREIDTHDICTKQLKRWTIQKMIRFGLITRRNRNEDAGGVPLYEYSVNDEKNGGVK